MRLSKSYLPKRQGRLGTNSLRREIGDNRTRTGNPRLAKPVLYQLSYVPVFRGGPR